MLAKVVATLALMVISFGVTLGNYWYVFGIWPRSWVLYVVFCTLQIFMYGLLTAVGKSK